MSPVFTTNTIRQIPEEKWDALTDDNVFAGHSWLLTMEESLLKNVIPTYFLYQENGRLSGAAICYPVDKNMELFSPDNLLLGRLKKYIHLLGISFLPSVICAPMKAYGKHILLEKNISHPKKEMIVKTLLDAIEAAAKRKKSSVSFPRILEEENLLCKHLRQRGYLQTLDLPLAYMDIPWDSFDAYKRYIRKHSLGMKKNIAHEVNKNRKAGVTIESINNFNGQEHVYYSLINDNFYKHNQGHLPFKENFLHRLKKNFNTDLVIYRSLKRGKMSGLGIMLKKADTASLVFAGINRHLAQNDATFFNMFFYRPITDAISQNIRRLYYGNAMYEMKIRRGCKISTAFFFHKPRHSFSNPAVRFWFYLHHFWYRKKLPQSQGSQGF